MTTHYDDIAAAGATISHHTPDAQIGEFILGVGQYALAIGDDPTAVVYGTIEDLARFISRLDAELTHIHRHDTKAREASGVEGQRAELLAALGGVGVTEAWTTDEMRELFSVESFLAPFVMVRRKSDGARGTLQFQASPRFYHSWVSEL